MLLRFSQLLRPGRSAQNRKRRPQCAWVSEVLHLETASIFSNYLKIEFRNRPGKYCLNCRMKKVIMVCLTITVNVLFLEPTNAKKRDRLRCVSVLLCGIYCASVHLLRLPSRLDSALPSENLPRNRDRRANVDQKRTPHKDKGAQLLNSCYIYYLYYRYC